MITKTSKAPQSAPRSAVRANTAVTEHRKIFEAIAARNGDLAEKIMLEHVLNAKENITRLS